jgi:hypothetical protein
MKKLEAQKLKMDCNPSCLGARGWRISSLRPVQAMLAIALYLKKVQIKGLGLAEWLK